MNKNFFSISPYDVGDRLLRNVGHLYQTTRRNIAEGNNINILRRQNIIINPSAKALWWNCAVQGARILRHIVSATVRRGTGIYFGPPLIMFHSYVYIYNHNATIYERSPPNIIWVVKSRKMCQVPRMGQKRKVYRVLAWKPERWPRRRWKDNRKWILNWTKFIWLTRGRGGVLLWTR
jgi:hypothetical protein